MSVPAGKRKQSKFEAVHHYYTLRDEVTELMLLDFGFSREKYLRQLEKYKASHQADPSVEEITARWKAKAGAFYKWFIDKECDAVLMMLRSIESEFSMGNSIYPSDTPARMAEFCERRKHIDNAIAGCYVLKQELNYIIRTLPVDLNKYKRFAHLIDEQVALYKGVRTADNKFLKKR